MQTFEKQCKHLKKNYSASQNEPVEEVGVIHGTKNLYFHKKPRFLELLSQAGTKEKKTTKKPQAPAKSKKNT